MPDTPESPTPSAPEIQTRLHDVAKLLRETETLDPEARHVLAELVDELTTALQASNAPPAEVAQLAASAAHLAEALRQQHDQEQLGNARDHFGAAVSTMGAPSLAANMVLFPHQKKLYPDFADLARRLVDALANIGI